MKYWLWPLVIAGSALGAELITFFPPLAALSAGLRLGVTLWFLLICPGMAFIPLLRLPSASSEWTLAIALSLALSTLVPEFMLYTVRWSPQASLVLLVSLSLLGAILQLLLLRQAPVEFAPEPITVPDDSERKVL